MELSIPTICDDIIPEFAPLTITAPVVPIIVLYREFDKHDDDPMILPGVFIVEFNVLINDAPSLTLPTVALVDAATKLLDVVTDKVPAFPNETGPSFASNTRFVSLCIFTVLDTKTGPVR